MVISTVSILVSIGGGLLAGIINTLAGNGSAITLSILTEVLGLPPTVANATNRIGICTQTYAANYVFHKNGQIKWRSSLYILIPIIAGSIAGIYVAMNVSNEQFRAVFSYLMIFVLFVLLVNPKRWLHDGVVVRDLHPLISIPVYTALGFYGGFIQMGMGIFFLVFMVLGLRWNLTQANALKSVVISIYTTIAILIFHYHGLIDWRIGGIMAIGQTTGGWLAANFLSKSKQANVWAHRILVVMVIVMLVRLFFIK